MQISKEYWGTCHSQEVYLFTLSNAAGSTVKLTNYGARIIAIQVPDNQGKVEDVVLGFDSFTPYLEDESFMGATIGRFANRISNANFTLDGELWRLEANEGMHCNHSGSVGFDHRVFDITEVAECTIEGKAAAKVIFSLCDADRNGGFPGNLQLKIIYCWTERGDSLHIIYEGCSDRKGILNLTNHSYFNLFGLNKTSEDYLDGLAQRLEIKADRVLEVDRENIPTGQITPIDKSRVSGIIQHQCRVGMASAGMVWDNNEAELPFAVRYVEQENPVPEPETVHFKGLNTCFELRTTDQPIACLLKCDRTGRELEVATSYPGLLVYTGDGLYSRLPGQLGRPFRAFDGVALECQYYPDAPNRPEFPPTIIDRDKPYHEYITYKFSVVGHE